MGFTKVTFLFAFLPLSIIFYFAGYRISEQDPKVCNAVLVCESLVFLWWTEPKMMMFFVSLTILMHIMGGCICRSGSSDEKRLLLMFSVIVFAFLPVLYRYLPAMEIIAADEERVNMPLFSALLVPVGLSFMVLSALSYILDIYLDKEQPGSLLDSFVFITFFPKAVCGPVVLWRDFKPQLGRRKTGVERVSSGLGRIVIGYAKKAIIADTFAAQIVLIDSKMVACCTDSITTWLLALLFFFRIYYDFSGYSDIAIGLCSLLGFDVGENFDRPYLSASLTDFWRRWHISLGRWFREYIYIPLGGNRTGNAYFNILITFLIAGLWHGWKLNLLLWGLLNGIIVITEKALSGKSGSSKGVVWHRAVLTMSIVFAGWILFRAADMTAAAESFKALFVSPGGSTPNFTWRFFMTRRITVFLMIAALWAFGAFSKVEDMIKNRMDPTSYEIMSKLFLLLLFAIDIMFVLGTTYTPFIYTQIP